MSLLPVIPAIGLVTTVGQAAEVGSSQGAGTPAVVRRATPGAGADEASAVASPRVSKARRAYTEAFTVPELRAQCRARGIPHTGVKAVLVDRIVNEPVKTPPDYGEKLRKYMNL